MAPGALPGEVLRSLRRGVELERWSEMDWKKDVFFFCECVWVFAFKQWIFDDFGTELVKNI